MAGQRFKLRVRELREKRLLATAEKMMAAGGCELFTINDLASSAGVAKGTVYTHFRSQDDLVEAVLSRVSAQLLGRLKSQASGGALERLEASLSLITREVADRSHGHLGHPCCLKRSPCPYRGPREIAAVLRNMIQDVRAEGVAVLDIDPDLACTLFAGLLAAVDHWHDDVAQTGEHLSAMCQLFLNGLIPSRASLEPQGNQNAPIASRI